MERTRRSRDRAGGLYHPAFSQEELRALTVSNGRPVLDDEIDLLRLLIRRLVGDDATGQEPVDIEAVGRLIDRLGRLLRTRQHVVSSTNQSGSDIQTIFKTFEDVQRDWSSELRGTRDIRLVPDASNQLEEGTPTSSTVEEVA